MILPRELVGMKADIIGGRPSERPNLSPSIVSYNQETHHGSNDQSIRAIQSGELRETLEIFDRIRLLRLRRDIPESYIDPNHGYF